MFLEAVSNLDLKAADILVKKYPKLLNSHCRARDSIPPRLFSIFAFDYDCIKAVTDVVLLTGTYEQCQFIMKHMLSQRSVGSGFPERSRWKRLQSLSLFHRFRHDRKATYEEEGGPEWHRCPLDSDEYNALLLGNILRNDPNRKALWSVISTQIASGHSRSAQYLKKAVEVSNTEALVELLDRGWRVNGSWRHCLDTPLQHALMKDNLLMAASSRDDWWLDALIELHGVFGAPALQGPRLGTHHQIYMAYQGARRIQALDLCRLKIDEAAAILRKYGGRVSLFSSTTRTISAAGGAVLAWAFILHSLLYAVVLPLVLIYAPQGVWHDMSTGQKFGFAYLWTLISYFVPHFWIFKSVATESADSVVAQSFEIGWCSIVFLFNHVGLPYLVVGRGWRPIRSCNYFVENDELGSTCKDFTFLLPLITAGIEVVVTAVPLYIWILQEQLSSD